MDPEVLATLEALGKLWSTQRQVAAWFRCSERSVRRFFEENPDARQVFEEGRAMIELKHRQKLLASNSPHVMIYVGKALCGITEPTAAQTVLNLNAEVVDVLALKDVELDALLLAELSRFGREAQAPAVPELPAPAEPTTHT